MKTSILITGQPAGNAILKTAIRFSGEIESTYLPNGHKFTFATRKEARKALWEGYRTLLREEPEFKGIRYSAKRALHYDASKAEINYGD